MLRYAKLYYLCKIYNIVMARKTFPWWLKPATIERLSNEGKFHESQDGLINRLLDELQELRKKLVK